MNLTAIRSPHDPDMALWLVSLEAGAQPALEWHSWLSPEELARASRFHFEADARRYRTSHAALRTLLARLTGLAPLALRLVDGSNGKPRLLAPRDLHFNLSHSGEWALIGVSHQGPIGVDIEVARPLDDADSLAERNFTPKEYRDYLNAPAPERLQTFYRCWTRKEACLKALGSGLSIEPGVFDAGVQAEPAPATIAVAGQPCRMSVFSIDLPFNALLAAGARVDAADHHLAM